MSAWVIGEDPGLAQDSTTAAAALALILSGYWAEPAEREPRTTWRLQPK